MGTLSCQASDGKSQNGLRYLPPCGQHDFGFRYGAGRAHGRLATCLAEAQYDVVVYAFLEGLGDPKICQFETAVAAMRAAKVDVIILGNLHGAFPEGVDLAEMAELAPVLIITHDFFPFTGRCPYPLGCDEYLFLCPTACPTREQYPVIPFEKIPDAHSVKLRNLAIGNVHFVANSAYMEVSARRLLAIKQPDADLERRVHCIPLPVPEAAFQPGDREAARAALGLAPNDFMVLTVSSNVNDRRKGFRHTLEACNLVKDARVRLFALGWIAPDLRVDEVTYLGHVENDEELARYFSAADVFVSATADETFGQTFVEAAMCGCPSIGYAVGGVRDALIPGETGWLVERNDIAALASKTRELLNMNHTDREAMRHRAHVYAASRWGAAGFLAAISDIFRSVVGTDAAIIPAGVQYGGILRVPIRYLKDPALTFGEGFDPLEGPFPTLGINRQLRWMTAPRTTLHLQSPVAGPHLLTLDLVNIHSLQMVTLFRDETRIANFKLPGGPWSVHYVVRLALDLPAGVTALRLSAPGHFKTPDRNLHLAVLGATLEPVDVADGLRGVERRVEASAWEEPGGSAVAASEAASALPGLSLQPDLRLLDGFNGIEGPYPQIGVPMRLAWLIEARGTLTVAAAPGARVLSLDVHLPCPQELILTTAAGRQHYPALASTSWDRPARLVVRLPEQDEGWHLIEIECEHDFIDDAGRGLRLAVLGAQMGPGHPAAMTDQYGLLDMALSVQTAASGIDDNEG